MNRSKLIEIIISNMILALFVGLIVGLILFWFEQRNLNRNSEEKIIGIDEYNYGIACLVKHVYSKNDKNFLAKYDTAIYKDNLDFLAKKDRELQMRIKNNIIYMETSNKMMDVLLEKNTPPNGLSVNNIEEIKSNLIVSADLILKNIHQYNKTLTLINCADASWFTQ